VFFFDDEQGKYPPYSCQIKCTVFKLTLCTKDYFRFFVRLNKIKFKIFVRLNFVGLKIRNPVEEDDANGDFHQEKYFLATRLCTAS